MTWPLRLREQWVKAIRASGLPLVTVMHPRACVSAAATNGAGMAIMALAMVVAGFLFWNFPPARIFMGDTGSGFLGIASRCKPPGSHHSCCGVG